MRPLWVIQSFQYRALDLVPLAARQLERSGYLVRIAEETDHSWVQGLVVLAVKPRWRWWLELVRWVSSRCRFAGHRWVLSRSFQRGGSGFRYLWHCRRCGISCVTRTADLPGGRSDGAL